MTNSIICCTEIAMHQYYTAAANDSLKYIILHTK